MNDAHIYVALDQVEDEFRKIMKMYSEFYQTFGLKNYRFRLSIRGKDNADKFRGDDAMWTRAEELLEKALKDLNVDFFVGEGEAAFYGPKVDIQFKNLMGREETVSTIQIDYLSPKNFDLKYTEQGGGDGVPVIIHRSPLSTHERFISYLIEYYGGAFPTWCSPVQVNLIPVNTDCEPFCRKLAEELHASFVRVEVDTSDNSFNKKIRNSTVRKNPMTLIIGNKEVADSTVTIRRYGVEKQETLSVADFKKSLFEEIRNRVMTREPMSSFL
jgi:threonyl-tRNA synthetase